MEKIKIIFFEPQDATFFVRMTIFSAKTQLYHQYSYTLKSIHFLKNYFLLIISIFFCLNLTFCTRNTITTSELDKLEFSTDTLSFDTVFTTVGSTTKGFLIFNPHKQRIVITSIALGGGEDSPFRMNVNGTPTDYLENVEIWPEDSLYIFVEVTVNPTDELTPFVVEDSIVFETNQNVQQVKLVAWGQDANFFGPGTPNGYLVGSTGDTTWTNNKPYVIYDGIIIDSLSRLTIEAGTQIHLHNGAVLYAKGTLDVQGGIDTSDFVVFQGTRLEENYQGIPGQWGGIYLLRGSENNYINGAIIKNATVGVRIDSLPINGLENPNLILENSIIHNTFDSGILAITSVIAASNCLIYDCGRNNLQLLYGGIYNFLNCTFYNRTSLVLDHENPILFATNYLALSETEILAAPLQLNFVNSILYGSEDEEIGLDKVEEVEHNVTFQHCLLKTEIGQDSIIFNEACIFNPASQDTIFIDQFERDFRLNSSSPCVNKGQSDIGLTAGSNTLIPNPDLLGRERDEEWDIGVFEFGE